MPLPDTDDPVRSLIGTPGYPCVMAVSAARRDTVHVEPCGAFGTPEAVEALARGLAAFARAPEPDHGVRSFLAVFDGAAPATEAAFEATLWDTLSALHARDEEPWDSTVASDPASPHFSYSFAGRAFYVVGLHPAASRPARRSAVPALVFNLHEQFETLRREGRYDKVRALIRERDTAFSGSVNPMLTDFGERSEARQYAGRAVDAGWACPFHATR